MVVAHVGRRAALAGAAKRTSKLAAGILPRGRTKLTSYAMQTCGIHRMKLLALRAPVLSM